MADRTYYYPNANGVQGWNANFRWEVTEHNDIATNQTTLTIRFQTYGNPLALRGLNGGTLSIEITDCNGTTHSYSANGKNASSWPGQWDYVSNSSGGLTTITATLPHKSDGTSWYSGRFTSYSAGRTYSGTWYQIDAPTSSFGRKDLQTIPRASSLSFTQAVINQTQTLTISRASNTFKHTITYTVGTATGTIISNSSETTATWVPALSLATQDTTHKYLSGTLTLTTFNGNQQIGQVAYPFSITIPEAIAKPVISGVSAEDTNATTIALTGNKYKILTNYSNLYVVSTITPQLSSTIVSKTITCGGDVINSHTGTFNGAKSNSITITATDSRGFITTYSYSTSGGAINYFKDTCSFTVEPPTPNGTTTLRITGNWFNGSLGTANNTISVYYAMAEDGGSFGNWVQVPATSSSNTYSANQALSGLDYRKSYSFKCKAVDRLYTATTSVITVKTTPVFDWGKNDFNINGDLNVNGTLKVNNGSFYHTILQAVYPVGAIYISTVATSPYNLFGFGTWVRIEGQFLLGANGTYSAGSTGGEASHTLSVNEIPSHNHGLSQNASFTVGGAGGAGQSGIPNNTAVWGSYGNAHWLELNINYNGGGQAHNNMPPYLSVYMWKRTA